MKMINDINFCGKVFMDKKKVAKNISLFPKETQLSIIGNVNTLKSRIEENSSPQENYYMDLKCIDTDRYCCKRKILDVHIMNDSNPREHYGAWMDISFWNYANPTNDPPKISDADEVWTGLFQPLTKMILKGIKKEPVMAENIKNIYNQLV